MNKESIYQIIGYNGEYNDRVKKAIKKLLKEYHPDHNGDEKVFKLINEVKKELEENKVSFDYKNKKINSDKRYSDIDYAYCEKMLNKLEKDEESITQKIKENYDIMENYEREYKTLYQKSIDKQKDILNLEQYKNRFDKIKKKAILLIILLIISFVFSIISKQIIVLIVFFVLAFMLFLEIKNFFVTFKDIKNKVEVKMNEYSNIFKMIKNNGKERKEKEEYLKEQEQKLNLIKNDIRFYHNILKHK